MPAPDSTSLQREAQYSQHKYQLRLCSSADPVGTEQEGSKSQSMSWAGAVDK